MDKLLKSRWGKAGAVLLIANEIRGIIVVAVVISGWLVR